MLQPSPEIGTDGARLATGARRRLAFGGLRHHRGPPYGVALEAAAGVSRTQGTWSPSVTWTPATGRPRSPAARSSATRCSSIALLSNIMAIVLQALCARLGIGAGRDLAQACRDAFPRAVSVPLWLRPRLRSARPISPKSLARRSASICCSAFRSRSAFCSPRSMCFVVLWMQSLGFRWVEAFIVTLLGVIAVCFAIQIAMADPRLGGVIRGFAPTTEIIAQSRQALSRARHPRARR